MDSSNEDTPLKNPIREFFGPPPPRRPIPSNSFNTLVKILSLFSDQDPFSGYASYAKLSDDLHNDVVAPRGEKEASGELVGSATPEAQNLSVYDKENNEGIAWDLCKDISFSGSEVIIDELGTTKNKTMDKLACDEVGNNDGMAEVDRVHEELSGIERILMDESDDFDVLQLPDKDTNFEFLNGFSSILDSDVCGNSFVTTESSQSGKMTVDGDMKEDLKSEKKQMDVEVNKLSSGGVEAKSDNQLSVVRVISECPEVVNQYARKKRKLCKEKLPQELSDFGGLTFPAQKSNSEGVANSIRKENNPDNATKGKPEKSKVTSVEDVQSGKSNLSFIDSRTSYSSESRGADPVVSGKMVKQNVCGNTGKSSARKVGNNRPKSRERFQYSRVELLNLRKMTCVPEDILKIVREIDAELHHRKDQNSAAGKMSGSSILKDIERGSSLETKKEKKKRQKRKKRAEMNKKLGVKRLKLKPVVKPKVISHCRHYLKGRCQEGEKCKFSHDVIPLTKSKPCCHFARQACMKGNDCPFDHQLSKYPCNSYVAAGSCNRGDSCLFSHKIPSETAAGVSKCETNSLDQHDKSNSKQKLSANTSICSETATPKSLKEGSVMQSSQHGKAPKGLSFLSSEKSLLKDSGKHEKADLSQKSDSASVVSSQPNTATATATAANLVKSWMDMPASSAPQGMESSSFVKNPVGILGDKKQANPSFHGDNSSFHSSGKKTLQEADKLEKVGSSRPSRSTGGGDQLNKGMSNRVLTVRAPSCSGSLYDNSGGESRAALPTKGHPDTWIGEKGSANISDKAIQQNLWGSPTSLGQCSIKTRVKNTPSTAQRAFLSTLAFAAKYESGIKMSSATSSKEAVMNEGTSSGPSKASAILEFLYSGGNKEKQKGRS